MLARMILVGTLVLTLSVCTCFGVGRRTIGPTLPKKAMKLDTFLSQIATGHTYQQLYAVFASPQPDLMVLRTFQMKISARLSRVGSPLVTLSSTGRTANGTCYPDIRNLKLAIQASPCKRAIFDGISEPSRNWYFTTKPDEYLLEMSCNDFNGKACPGDFYFSLYAVRFPPNQFDWKRAVTEAKKQVGIDFTDPRSAFVRTADECPGPNR